MAENKAALDAQKKGFLQILTAIIEYFTTPTLFAFICWALPPITICFGLSLFFELNNITYITIIIVGFFAFAGTFLSYFSFEVPSYTAINMYHYYNGDIFTYFPGFYFKYPWLVLNNKETSIIEIKSIEISLEEDYPAKDGVPMLAKGTMELRPDPHNAEIFEGLTEEIINKAMKETFSARLSTIVAKGISTELRGDTDLIEKDLEEIFGVDLRKEEKEKRRRKRINENFFSQRKTTPLERSYGIICERVTISDFDYHPDYQKVLTDQKATENLKEIALQHFLDNGGKAEVKKVYKKRVITEEFLSTKIKNAGFSLKIFRILSKMGAQTIKDLLSLNEANLFSIDGFDTKDAEEIKNNLFYTKELESTSIKVTKKGLKTMPECFNFALESTGKVKTTHFKNMGDGSKIKPVVDPTISEGGQ